MGYRYYCPYERKWHLSAWGYIKRCFFCNNLLFHWTSFLRPKGKRHVQDRPSAARHTAHRRV